MSYGIKAHISDKMGSNKLCVVTISNAYFSSHSSYCEEQVPLDRFINGM